MRFPFVPGLIACGVWCSACQSERLTSPPAPAGVSTPTRAAPHSAGATPSAPLGMHQSEHEPYIRRQWMLVAMPGFTRDELVRMRAHMDWTALPRMSAHMGCNQLMGSAVLSSDGRIEVKQLAATRMACADMRMEQAFTQLLPTMTNWDTSRAHRLVLRNAAGQMLEFVAADWD